MDLSATCSSYGRRIHSTCSRWVQALICMYATSTLHSPVDAIGWHMFSPPDKCPFPWRMWTSSNARFLWSTCPTWHLICFIHVCTACLCIQHTDIEITLHPTSVAVDCAYTLCAGRQGGLERICPFSHFDTLINGFYNNVINWFVHRRTVVTSGVLGPALC